MLPTPMNNNNANVAYWSAARRRRENKIPSFVPSDNGKEIDVIGQDGTPGKEYIIGGYQNENFCPASDVENAVQAYYATCVYEVMNNDGIPIHTYLLDAEGKPTNNLEYYSIEDLEQVLILIKKGLESVDPYMEQVQLPCNRSPLLADEIDARRVKDRLRDAKSEVSDRISKMEEQYCSSD